LSQSIAAAPRQVSRGPAEERLHRKQRLAATLRIFSWYGYDEGAGGHVTARDPEYPDRFWVNPFGMYFGHVRVSDLLLVDHDGTVIAGEGRVNPAGYAIHSRLHAHRPDVVCAAHTHSTYGRAWSALGRPLPPLTQDACAFYQDHEVYPDYTGVVLSLDDADRIAARLGLAKGLILANHGLLTVGASVAEAAWWFISMERCCQVQLAAEAAGRPNLIGPDQARVTREQIGTAAIGRLNFRPLYAAIVRREPDLLT
jgi:ribulose-5-phosphate 4-epimerase/fuculose-1-phosphate aldolase